MTGSSFSSSGWRIAVIALLLLALGGAWCFDGASRPGLQRQELTTSEKLAPAEENPATTLEDRFTPPILRESSVPEAANREGHHGQVHGQLFSYFDAAPIPGLVRVFRDSETFAVIPADDDGRFAWTPPKPGVYFLELHRDSEDTEFYPLPNHLMESHTEGRWQETSTRVRVEDLRTPVPDCVVYAYRPPALSGRVMTSTKIPIEGAFVQLTMPFPYGNGGWHTEWTLTDADGHFTITETIPGTGQLSVSILGDADGWIPPEAMDISLREGQHLSMEPVVFRKGTAEIRGRIVDQFGEPFGDLEIWCQVAGQSFGSKALSSTSKPGGEFTFPDLPVGAYTVQPTRATYPGPAKDTLGKVAWWVWPIPVEIAVEGSSTDIGDVVIPRPQWFKQTIHFVWPQGGQASLESSDFRIEVVEDEAIQALTRAVVVAGVQESRQHDWLNAPPWFNHQPFQEWTRTEGGYSLEISCLAPHAPIEISHHGRKGKNGLIHTVYPIAGNQPPLTISIGD